MSRNSVSWSRAHQGKRRHRTAVGAWLHAVKILIKFRDRLHVYQCQWGDNKQPMARAHYHIGHAPGSVPSRPGDPRVPGMHVNRPGRQMILGFSELQLSTLKSRAAGRGMPWQKYAAEIIHDALARPVPRPLPDLGADCPVCGDTGQECPCGQMTIGDCLGGCISHLEILPDAYRHGPEDEIIVRRCPVHEEPVGDGRHCIACDGGVF